MNFNESIEGAKVPAQQCEWTRDEREKPECPDQPLGIEDNQMGVTARDIG